MGIIEVERKRDLSGSPEMVKNRLRDLGYQEEDPVIEIDTYYSRPDVDYMATVECLRVRSRNSFAEITYKPASNNSTHSAENVVSKPEVNVALSDANQSVLADQLLRAIGMIHLVRVEKKRSKYRHPGDRNITIVVDTVSGAGIFAETEIMAEDADAAALRLAEIEREVGLTEYPTVDRPYRDLVLWNATQLT